MANIAQNVTELIGNTPLVTINNAITSKATILGKFEALNPGSSVKDRIALAIVRDAEAKGELQPGGTIVEATSGNTGVGLAMVGAALGYRVVITMPESMSQERKVLMRAFGAELILTPASEGMKGAVAKAEEIVHERHNAILAQQFANPANPDIHAKTTAQEILKQTDGNLDVFIAGIGTGGTISGVGSELKKALGNTVHIVGVEPADSPLLSSGTAGPHAIQGIGANFVPKNLNQDILDEIITVSNEEALSMSRNVAQHDGLLVGISSGAALHAASVVANRPEYNNSRIVVMMPDTGERYISTALFAPYITE